MNYGYCRMNNVIKINQPPYEIGKEYSNISESKTLEKIFIKISGKIPKFIKEGFYFWVDNIPIPINQKQKMIELGADINAILKCQVQEKDILSWERSGNCIRTKKFKVLQEI